MQEYATVKHAAQIEIVVNKSRFIGYCAPAQTEEEARAHLEDIRKQHREASHNCYAYSIGRTGNLTRFSDDGEPGGTAGLPMLEAMRNKGLTDLVCIVTRYFGGVLLGAGGLVRAYSKTASAAMEAAKPICMRPCLQYRVRMDYASHCILEPLLKQHGALKELKYTENVSALVIIPSENGDAFVRMVIDRTDGKIVPVLEGQSYEAFTMSS